MKRKALRLQSLFLILALAVSSLIPGFSKATSNIEASAASHEIEITDANGNTVTENIFVMESEQVQLSYELIDCSMPQNGYVVWRSDTPLNASVDQTGLVRGHDSSKGAAVRLWLDNDVKTIPVIGKSLAKTLESVLYSDDINLDTMDTEAIVTVVGETLGVSSGPLAESLTSSLRERLNSLGTKIIIELYDQYDSMVATDTVHVVVTNSDKWYANVLPNGAFIVNKDSLPTTVAVGGKLTLEGGVTPLRLGYGVTWELEAPSILDKAEDYATFDPATGEIVFLKTGKVTVKVYPNADEIVAKLMGYINDLASLGNEVDTSDIADVLVKVLGLNVSTNTVKFAIDIIAAIAGAGTNTADMLTQATKYVANWILEASINDKITFNIVDSLEIKSFSIGGNLEVAEGKTSQLFITDIVPAGANSTNVVWSVADESVAYVDKYGILIGRDAGGITNLNKKTTTVTATVDGISSSADVTVTGALITQPVDIKIDGPSVVELGSVAQYTAEVYPDRSNATIRWGLVNSEGKVVFAKDNAPATNDFGSIDVDGNFTATNGGMVEIVAKAGTISTCQRSYSVYIGTLAQGIDIDQGDYLVVEVPGTKTYNSMKTQLTVTFNPPNATNQNVRWSVLEGSNIEVSPSGVVKPSKNRAAWGVIQAKSFDGGYTDTIAVSFANYPVTGISVSPTASELIVGNTVDINETIEPLGTGAEGAKIGDASIKAVRWTSTDETVATVDENGVVTAVDSGTCEIVAVTRDGGFEARTTITVRPDKTRLNYAIKLFESGKVTAENCAPEDWAALEAAYNQALEIQGMEFAYQSSCDKAAQQIITLYDKVGAYVPLYGVDVLLEGESAPEYNSVKVSTSKRYTDYSIDLDGVFIPENAMYASVEWKSSNPGALTVDQNGVCKPAKNSACWAEIKYTATDYMGNVVSDSVIVSFANYPVTGVTLDKYEISDALVYNTGKLVPTIEPRGAIGIADASIKDVTWSSSNVSVVTVDQDGNLTYKAPGTAVITVTTVDGGHKAICIVKVSVNKTALAATIADMDAYQLVAEEYTNASFSEYKAAYDNAKAVMENVDSTQKMVDNANQDLIDAYKGLVRFIKTESVMIQVKGDEGLVEAPEYISVKYTTSTLQLYSRILPLDSMYVSVDWSTDSSSIVVDENGLVKPKSSTSAGYGWVTISVTDERGNVVTDKVHVSFALYPVTHVELTPQAIETSLDEAPVKIEAVCKHKATDIVTHDASIQKVYWTSDNETAVTVDENGQLTYHNAGQATITATAADGGIQVTCVVTVAGDKSKLREAIAKADEAQINIQDHTYETSMAYVAAYDHAKEVEASVLYTQEEIDAAAENLFATMEALLPYIHMTELNVYHDGKVNPGYVVVEVKTLTFTNKSVTLTYDYAPADAMFKSIEWSSSNDSVKVENGVVKPTKNKGCGAAITLTATDHYGNKIENTTYVAFSNAQAKPTGISIDKTELSVPYGAEPETIKATVSHNTTNYWFETYGVSEVAWKTTDADVATVENGVVTFVEAGTCQIIASTVYGGLTVVCDVTVLSDKTPLEEAYGKSNYAASRKDEYSIESWEPFAEAYANAERILAINNPKQRDINAAAQALNEAYENLDRYIKVQKVAIRYNNSSNYSHISVKVGTAAIYTNQSIHLGFEYFPSNATFETFEWSSSNDSIEVSQAGVCKPTKNEACWSIITITLTDKKDRTFSDSVYVSFVKNQVEGVSISYDTSVDAIVGGTKQLIANISPDKADIKAVTWSSSDESLAIVDANGLVTFLNTGEVEITATTCDGGKTTTSTIKIYADKSELNEVMTYVENLKYTDYTPASWSELQEKYNAALEVYNNADPTQDEVNNVRIALSDAISNLVEYVYISDVKISCDGNTAQNINVIVPEGEPYIGAYANISFVVNPENAMYSVTEWSYDGTIVLNPVSGIVAPSVNEPCFGKVYLTLIDDFGNEYKTTSYVTFARNPVSSIELNAELIETNVNAQPIQLEATVIGVNGGPADISEVIWTSSNPNVASVDDNGLVSFHAGGYTEIKAESIVGGYNAICKVYVTTDKSALQAILQKTIDENYQRLDYIETTYDAYLEAYNNAIIVYSNNEASQEEIDDATEWLTNAIDALEPYVHVESIVITADSNSNLTVNGDHFTYEDPGSIVSNRTIQLNCTLNPGNAMYETITWQSDNSDISVDQNGLVKSLTNTQQAAAITITVTDYYGVKYVKTVHVSFIKWASASVSGVTISHSEISGSSGGNFTLTHEIQKSGLGEPEIKDVIWTSSNEKVATVNSEGKVFFIDSGECYITVTTVQGGYSASCKVIVTATEAKLRLAQAIERAKAYDSSLYTEETFEILTNVIPQAESVYNTFYATTTQINEAIALIENAENQLVYVPADYTEVNDAIDRFKALNKDYYKPEDIQAIQTIIDGVDYGLDVSYKSVVDKYAADINYAIDSLVELDADYTALREAISTANDVNRDIYSNIDTLDEPLSAAVTASETEYKISQQAELDAITEKLNKAVEGLVLKAADKKALNNALKLKLTNKYLPFYDAELLAEWETLVAEGQEMSANDELTILDNEIIKAKAQDIMMAYAAVEASYNVVIDKTVLEDAISEAKKVIVENYEVDDAFEEYESALEAGIALLEEESEDEEYQISIDAAAERILNAIKNLNVRRAEYSEVNDAIERFNDIDKYIFTEDSIKAVQDIIDTIVWDLDFTNQEIVDKYTEDINNAINNLVPIEETRIIAIINAGSTVNDEDKFIHGVDEGLTDIEEYVRVINGTLNCTETENGLGTGATIEVINDDVEVVDSYTLIIFGDVNGDGLVDGQDSLLIWMIIWTGEVDDEAIMLAADANKDGVVDETDAELVEQAGVYEATVEQR